MLFTKKLRPPERREGDIRRIYEHIFYMQETLEIKFSELEKRLAAAEKRIEQLEHTEAGA